MRDFLKFAFTMWGMMGLIAPLVIGPLLSVQNKITGAILFSASLVISLFIAAWPKSEAQLKTSAESLRFWRKPWWQCICLSIFIFVPAILLNEGVDGIVHDSVIKPLPAVSAGLIFAILFGVLIKWRAERSDLTAQSDS